MLIAAFLLGFLGSLHCAGMCGPIALALPKRGISKQAAIHDRLLYNLGRVTMYGLLGLVVGSLGHGLLLMGFQSYVSILMGVIFILFGLLAVNLDTVLLKIPLIQKWFSLTGQLLSSYLKHQPAFFVVGMLNGLLPCGLVYSALLGAIATGDILLAISFMMIFGIGTFPMMLAASLGGHLIDINLRQKIKKAYPVFFVAVGIFLIVRGNPTEILNFSDQNPKEAVECH